MFIVLFWSITSAWAQLFTPEEGMLSRDIRVEQYVNGTVVQSWPWVDYGLYYSAILQMAYDPVLPPERWEIIKTLPDRLVVTERSRSGKLLRRFDVSDTNYVYTYQTYSESFFRDTAHLADQIRAGFNALPVAGGPKSGGPQPMTVMIEDIDNTSAHAAAANTPVLSSLTAMIQSGLSMARPFDALEDMNLVQKFSGPGTIQILIAPDQGDLPDEIALQDGQIRVRRSGSVARGYVDRHQWRAAAMDQKRLYDIWKARGINTPPKER